MIDTQAANKKHTKSSRIYTLILFTYIFLSYIKSSFGLPDIYLQLFLYSFFGISFIRLLFNRFPNTIITFAFWYGGFIALSLISSFYADSSYMTMIMIKDLVMAFLMGVSLVFYKQKMNRKCKNIFIISE